MPVQLSRLCHAGGAAVAAFWLYDIGTREWSVRHTWPSALTQYFSSWFLAAYGRRQLLRLRREAERGEEVQRRLLTEILQRHQGQDTTMATVEERRHLQGVATYNLFRESQPITCRGDYNKGGPFHNEGELAQTKSGHEEMRRIFFYRAVLTSFAVLAQFFPESLDELQRAAVLSSVRDVLLLLGLSEMASQRLSFVLASPLEAYDLSDADRLYVHALFALKDPALGIIQSGSAWGVRRLLQAAKENRRHLVQDMRNGHLWDRQLPEAAPEPKLRAALDVALSGPDGHRSREVDRMLKTSAVASDLWPRLKVVVITGEASLDESLKEAVGEVPIYGPLYTSDEGYIGINLFPELPFGVWTYLLDPGSMFFELAPAGSHDVHPDMVIPAWEAVVGQEYDLLVTTHSGLCRCRLGDRVRVHAMFGQMPIVSVAKGDTGLDCPSVHCCIAPARLVGVASSTSSIHVQRGLKAVGL
ncbi:GH3.2 [Symbiodinium sp. CCMP2456]|nr:GH3.2 [Symbiodinium sp. CCMP2456]